MCRQIIRDIWRLPLNAGAFLATPYLLQEARKHKHITTMADLPPVHSTLEAVYPTRSDGIESVKSRYAHHSHKPSHTQLDMNKSLRSLLSCTMLSLNSL